VTCCNTVTQPFTWKKTQPQVGSTFWGQPLSPPPLPSQPCSALCPRAQSVFSSLLPCSPRTHLLPIHSLSSHSRPSGHDSPRPRMSSPNAGARTRPHRAPPHTSLSCSHLGPSLHFRIHLLQPLPATSPQIWQEGLALGTGASGPLEVTLGHRDGSGHGAQKRQECLQAASLCSPCWPGGTSRLPQTWTVPSLDLREKGQVGE
jgi:hypothetical protein